MLATHYLLLTTLYALLTTHYSLLTTYYLRHTNPNRYLEWLAAVWPTLWNPVLVLCTDDAQRALASELRNYQPVLLLPHLCAQPELRAAAHAACGDQLTDGALEMLADWGAMRAADILVTANSTFSASAALLAQPVVPPAPHSRTATARFWRPDPSHSAMVPYDPAAAPPLLNACTSGTLFRKQQSGWKRDAAV